MMKSSSTLFLAALFTARLATASTPEIAPALDLGLPEAQDMACRVVIPVARPDSVTIPVNQKIDINLFANDSNTSLGLAYVTNGSHGTVRVLSGGVVTYSPNVGYIGTDSFDYGVNACLQCFSGWCSEPDIRDTTVTVTITN